MLELDGRVVHDSSAIIAALEREFPDPPLYPSDPDAQARALTLEKWFDDELGPAVRLLALHEVARDPAALAQLAARHVPVHMKPFPRAWAAQFAGFLRTRYGLDRPGAADAARAGVARAFDRLESELGGGEHLVGETFTVADLAAAAHLYWLVQPPEGPRIVERLPAPLAAFMAQFEERPGYRWVQDTYRRHRRPATALREQALA